MQTVIKNVRDSHIKAALNVLNNKKKLSYPDVGYSYYADIKGDGRNIRSVYTMIDANGGVTRSFMNGSTKRETLTQVQRATLELFDYAVSRTDSGAWVVSDPLDNAEGFRIELSSEADVVAEGYDYLLGLIS